MGRLLGGGTRSGAGKVIADGGGRPRWGVPILRGSLSGNGGRDADEGKMEDVEEAGGEYAWGLYPFCNVGLSVSNMGATVGIYDTRSMILFFRFHEISPRSDEVE